MTHVRFRGEECSAETGGKECDGFEVEVECACGEWCLVVPEDFGTRLDDGESWSEEFPACIKCDSCGRELEEWGMGLTFAETVAKFRALPIGEYIRL